MNYFELYEIPVSFLADEILIKQNYYANSKKYHPDFFINESEEKQAEVLHFSTLNNEAYRLLTDFDKRVAYILTLTGQITVAEKFVLPPDFLMEMMEFNEAWMDAEDENAKQGIIHQIEQIKNELYAPIKNYMEMDQIDSISQEAMLQIKSYYYKKKYLDRILEDFHH